MKKILLLLLTTLFLSVSLCACSLGSNSGSTGGANIGDGVIDDAEWCEVIFDSAGGEDVKPLLVAFGEKIPKPDDPIRQHDSRYEYSFGGWYVGNREWDFETDVVTEDVTLTAKWNVDGEYTDPFLPSD